MASRQLAMLTALLGIATPGHAFDTRNDAQTVMFYYAIPFGAQSKKESNPWMGMQINGKRDYQSYSSDVPLYTFNVAEGGAPAANLLIIGAVAVGAAVAVGSRGKSAKQETQQQQQAQQAAKPPAQDPVPCPTSCTP
jgi:hypothetical protein